MADESVGPGEEVELINCTFWNIEKEMLHKLTGTKVKNRIPHNWDKQIYIIRLHSILPVCVCMHLGQTP